jgi:hypothetical protein
MTTLFRLKIVSIAAIVLFCSVPATAQQLKIDPKQPQLLLAATSTITLQKELDQAGAVGFHATLGTTRGGGEMVVLLERDIRAAEKLQFKLIATSATKTFQNEIKDAALQGFRAVPRTFLNKPAGLSGNEIVVVMERPVKAGKKYEYKLLATNQTSVLESEWVVAMSQGYRAVGFITRSEVMLLMEREAN